MIRFEQLWWVLLFGVVIAPLLAGAAAAEKALPTSQAEIQLSYAPLVKEAAPAVVNIFSRRVVQTIRSPFFDDPFFRHFFGDEFSLGWIDKRVKNALGSGVIVTPRRLRRHQTPRHQGQRRNHRGAVGPAPVRRAGRVGR